LTLESALWVIAGSLFLAALGLPIPENPLLMGGGYAIFEQASPAVVSLLLWYVAIILGDITLFAVSYWFFTRPKVARMLMRLAGPRRFRAYRKLFAAKGGWTLFLARFTFGIRAVAYVAAGAAHFPWSKFLLVDGLSVAVQVALFVGIGFYAGERIGWAESTGGTVVVVLGVLATVTLLLTWGSTYLLRRLSERPEE